MMLKERERKRKEKGKEKLYSRVGYSDTIVWTFYIPERDHDSSVNFWNISKVILTVSSSQNKPWTECKLKCFN